MSVVNLKNTSPRKVCYLGAEVCKAMTVSRNSCTAKKHKFAVISQTFGDASVSSFCVC